MATKVIDEDMVQKASEIEVLDSTGDKIKFGSIFATQRTIVVFIRHFFCGSCQSYVEQLAGVPKEALEQAGTDIVIVGCGEWKAISYYVGKTGFKGRIYTEPTRELYRTLGMNIETTSPTPAGQEKRSYASGSTYAGNAIKGMAEFMKNPSLLGKQGNVSQIGGDFVIGPGNTCSYAHFMQHTEDHVEVAELMQQAGVQYQ